VIANFVMAGVLIVPQNVTIVYSILFFMQ